MLTDAHDHDQDKQITIIVDGTPHHVSKGVLTYDEVVTLAYPDHSQHPEITYSVTFSRGHNDKPEGSLPVGGTVKVKDGMVFRLNRTGAS